MSNNSENSEQFLFLSQEEMDELDDFLMSDNMSLETMMLTELDGYLTAIVSGPVTLKLSEWLPSVWGPSEQDKPTFKTKAQAQRTHELIIRHMNSIIWSLQDSPDAYEPIFDFWIYESQEYMDAEMWAFGYMRGVELCRKQWQPLFDDPNWPIVFRPIYLLGADEVTPEEELLTKTPIQCEELAKQIPASVAWFIVTGCLIGKQPLTVLSSLHFSTITQKLDATIHAHAVVGRNSRSAAGWRHCIKKSRRVPWVTT